MVDQPLPGSLFKIKEKNRYPYLYHPKYKGIEWCVHGINKKYCVVCSTIKLLPKSGPKKSKIIKLRPEK